MGPPIPGVSSTPPTPPRAALLSVVGVHRRLPVWRQHAGVRRLAVTRIPGRRVAVLRRGVWVRRRVLHLLLLRRRRTPSTSTSTRDIRPILQL